MKKVGGFLVFEFLNSGYSLPRSAKVYRGERVQSRRSESLKIIELTFRMLDLSNNLFLKLVSIQEHSFLFKQFG